MSYTCYTFNSNLLQTTPFLWKRIPAHKSTTTIKVAMARSAMTSMLNIVMAAVIISAAHGARPLGIPVKHVNMATALSPTPMELNAEEAPDGSDVLYDEAAGALTTAAAAIGYSNDMPVNGCHAIDCENKSSIYGP
jgi:hypothetical protein